MPGRPPQQGLIITREVITALSSFDAVKKSAQPNPPLDRMRLDIDSLESVVLFLAKYGKQHLRQRMVALAADSYLDASTPGATRTSRMGVTKKKES